MNAKSMTLPVTFTLSGLFLALACVFVLDLFGRHEPPKPLPLVDASATNAATVRVSAAQLIKSGEDASGLDCYACHDKGKTPKINHDERGNIVLSKEHSDLVMSHGRNETCFNCHDPQKLDVLRGRDGKQYTWEESSQLCGTCHGTTYNDWELGLHGRVSGHWDRSRGSRIREECASCHHPHSPEFPALPAAPGPNLLHPKASAPKERSH
jgi:hypothetical protein